jgi:DNA-binding FrmR family transcriptional regulator
MGHTIKGQTRLLARVRRLKGQVEAVERALLQEQECAEILQQLAAIRGAANGVMSMVLEGHVREHMGSAQDRDTQALLDVIRRYLK